MKGGESDLPVGAEVLQNKNKKISQRKTSAPHFLFFMYIKRTEKEIVRNCQLDKPNILLFIYYFSKEIKG